MRQSILNIMKLQKKSNSVREILRESISFVQI